MVTIGALWLPILLSAVLVWIASAIAWTASPHHKKDFRVIPDQDSFLAEVRGKNLTQGQYWFPYADDPKAMQSPEMMAKTEQGPNGILTVFPPGTGKAMILSVVYYLVVSYVVAYLTSRTLMAGEDYRAVARIAGTLAFAAYGFGFIPEAIWFGMPWKRAFKSVADAFVYALLTAGTFGAFWP